MDDIKDSSEDIRSYLVDMSVLFNDIKSIRDELSKSLFSYKDSNVESRKIFLNSKDYIDKKIKNIIDISKSNAAKCPELFLEQNNNFIKIIDEIILYYQNILDDIDLVQTGVSIHVLINNLENSINIFCKFYFEFSMANYENFILNLLEFNNFKKSLGNYLDDLKVYTKSISDTISVKIAKSKELDTECDHLIKNVKHGTKQKIITEMADFFNKQATNYEIISRWWMSAVMALSTLYLIFQGTVIINHIPGDTSDYIMKFSLLPIFIFLIVFFINQYNKSKNLFDEYKHKWVVVNSMGAMASNDEIVPAESLSIYYNTLFQAINRSPVEMLISKKNIEHDDENYMKLLTILLASGKKKNQI